MGNIVVTGAMVKCSFGTVPAALAVTTQAKLMIGGKPAATIQDMSPIVNIPSCGMCSSMANPTVASATAAALGVLTPMPCVPSTVGTWMPTQVKVTAGGKPCLINDSTVMCAYGGCITIKSPGQQKVNI